MRCAKKMTMVAIMLVLVLALVSAWPSVTSLEGVKDQAKENLKADSTTPVEEVPVEEVKEVKEEKAEKKWTGLFTKQENVLPEKVSAMRETLSSNLSNSKKIEALDTALTDIEMGLDAMNMAYNDLNALHVFGALKAGYKLDGSILAGVGFTAKKGKMIGSLDIMETINLKNKNFNFKDGISVTVGVGYQLF